MTTLAVDPYRDQLLKNGAPTLDAVLALLPRVSGPPAFDEKAVAAHAERLQTSPAIDTGHALLDRSIKTGLAMIDFTFQGDHPKYGADAYSHAEHDSFPPTIIAAVDALSAWGLGTRAAQLFRYWIGHFIKDNGTIDYYGPSLSEYGQLLHTAALLHERCGAAGWWTDVSGSLERMAEHLLALRRKAEETDGLVSGSPEADECDQVAKYFHNNAWLARGLMRWAALVDATGVRTASSPELVRTIAQALAADTLAAIERRWPKDHGDCWLPPQVEDVERPRTVTATRTGSYTNYRYWPELLSSGWLPRPMAERLVQARLSFGGQFCGMTRFMDWLDDWPLADYLFGLWALGRRDDFLLSLYGHVAYHQAEGHLTAYEQVTMPPGKPVAPYCVPCQLVAARAARLLVP